MRPENPWLEEELREAYSDLAKEQAELARLQGEIRELQAQVKSLTNEDRDTCGFCGAYWDDGKWRA